MIVICWPLVAEPMVTGPAELSVMPPVPRLSVRFVPPPCSVPPPVLLKTIPSAAWSAFRSTVCGVLTLVMLKVAVSPLPGTALGLGVVALLFVDQLVVLFQLVPVPFQ